jgi:FecR protein
MVSEEPVAPDTEVLAATDLTRPPRKPFHKDPLSITGWGVAIASIVAYWYFFERKPAPEPGQQIARLTAVEGKVKVRPNAREAWEAARLSDPLHVGDVVQTETRSGAQISFNSGSVVSVRPDSVVYIGGSAEASSAAWRVQSGHVNFSVGNETTRIVTPTVRTMAFPNASGNIDVTDTGETGVKIFRGQAEIETTQGQRVTLNANQAVQVDAAGRAGARLDLPPPPTLVAPAAKSRLPLVAPPATSASLSWNAVRNGVTYRVAIDYNVTQANLLLSAALDEPGIAGTSHDLTGLNVGRYFWRVSAVNKEGLEGAFSRVSFFSVVEHVTPQPTPTLGVKPPALLLHALEEVAPGVVHVGGRTDPGATVVVDGNTLEVMPDGSFSEHVRTRGPGGVVIRATGADGQFTEQARAVSRR